MSETNLIPNLKTSWIGNTWSGGDTWMQNFIVDMIVDANGHCFTDSPWDEGHNERGEYWYENGQWYVKKNGMNDAPQVSNKSIIINEIIWNIDINGVVKDASGKIIPNVGFATGLGLYIPKNYLMVADDAAGQHVIKFYDVTNDPILVKTFGVVGGIGAETPGQVTPTKFWGLMACGSDAAGNIYIAMSEEGVVLKRFAVVDPLNLNFDEVNVAEACGLHFLETCDVDPKTDGLEIFGKQERYSIDYSKPAGQQYKLIGYTLDKDKYPNDPRLKNQACTKIRYKDGRRFMFSFGQQEFAVNIYKFEEDIAVLFLTIPDLIVAVDDNCDIWFMGDPISVMRCNGVDGNGNLIYSSRTNFCPLPQPFKKLSHILFDSEHDEMYLAGGTPENPTQGWGHPGPVICKYKNWSSTQDLAWATILPWYHNEDSVFKRIVPEAWDFAGERLYIGYLIHDGATILPQPYQDSPGHIRVYNTRNGEFVGRLLAGPEVFYGSSWLDMNHVVTAFERCNGQHVIIREEAWKNKNIVYTYFPEGENGETTIKKVTLKKNSSGNTFMNNSFVDFVAEIELFSGNVSKVELYANSQLISTSLSSPFTFSVTNLPVGEETTIRAVAYDFNNRKGYSNRIYVKISDGTPEVSITTPSPKSIYLKTDSIPLKVSTVDFDGSVGKVEYFANEAKIGEVESPNQSFSWSNPVIGNVQLSARVTDNQSRTGVSKNVPIVVWDFKNADAVTNINQGVKYRYYEGSFSVLPDFDTLTTISSGTQLNFSLIPAQRQGGFGFRFDGYIKIDSSGLYTFYTSSDDGSKLFIGNELIVNNDGTHGMEEKFGRILLNSGYHKFVLDYAQGEGGIGLNVSYEGPNIDKKIIPNDKLFYGDSTPNPDPTPDPQPEPGALRTPENPENTENGLKYEYYEAPVIESLPNFDTLTPIKTGNILYFNAPANRTENFALRYKGFINVPIDGIYNFFTNSDDGSKLYIGDTMVVDNDGMHGSIEKSGSIGLKAGKHAITVTFFQRGGGASLDVYYSSSTITKQLIPSSVLYLVSPPPPISPGAKVTKATSRRSHGTKGSFDIVLSIDPNDPVNSIPVECRGGTKQAIFIEFDKPIISAGIVLETVAGKKALLESFIQHNDKSFTINLNTVSDAQLLKIHLNDITDLEGYKSAATLRMRILTGDIDGDGIVSQNDKAIMESYLWANEKSFRADINNSGGFTDSDLQSVKNRLGWKIV